jgi:hypothetical protein
MFENDGYKEERITTVTRRAADAAELAKLAKQFER